MSLTDLAAARVEAPVPLCADCGDALEDGDHPECDPLALWRLAEALPARVVVVWSDLLCDRR